LWFIEGAEHAVAEVDFVFIKHIVADVVRYNTDDCAISHVFRDKNTHPLDMIAYCEFRHLKFLQKPDELYHIEN